MKKPTIPQKCPHKVKVEKDKTYFWCACVLSQKQPFCDGSHRYNRYRSHAYEYMNKEGKFKSLKYLAFENKEIFFYGSKTINNQPLCDGSYSKP